MATVITKVVSNRHWLRQATQEIHDGIESDWGFPHGFTLKTDYLHFLHCALDAHSTYGLAAARCLGDKTQIADEANRITLLHKDLELPASKISNPDSRQLQCSYAWGIGYVLNGSVLGASLMLKHRLIKDSWPSLYLQASARFARSGNLSLFFRRLNAATLDLAQARRGAVDTFNLFSATRNGTPRPYFHSTREMADS